MCVCVCVCVCVCDRHLHLSKNAGLTTWRLEFWRYVTITAIDCTIFESFLDMLFFTNMAEHDWKALIIHTLLSSCFTAFSAYDIEFQNPSAELCKACLHSPTSSSPFDKLSPVCFHSCRRKWWERFYSWWYWKMVIPLSCGWLWPAKRWMPLSARQFYEEAHYNWLDSKLLNNTAFTELLHQMLTCHKNAQKVWL